MDELSNLRNPRRSFFFQRFAQNLDFRIRPLWPEILFFKPKPSPRSTCRNSYGSAKFIKCFAMSMPVHEIVPLGRSWTDCVSVHRVVIIAKLRNSIVSGDMLFTYKGFPKNRCPSPSIPTRLFVSWWLLWARISISLTCLSRRPSCQRRPLTLE